MQCRSMCVVSYHDCFLQKIQHYVVISTRCRQQEVLVHSFGLFSVVREKLLSSGQPVTIAMFNTLFEVWNIGCRHGDELV